MCFRYNRKGFKPPMTRRAAPRRARASATSTLAEQFRMAAFFTTAVAAIITLCSIFSRRREKREDSRIAQLQRENNRWRSWWEETGRNLGTTGNESRIISELKKENEEVKKDIKDLLAWIEERERKGIWKGQ